MSKILKRILIIVAVFLAVIAIAAFVLYKIFVTPNVKVALSLLNAKDDIKTSFNIYINDDEKNILNYVTKQAGESKYDVTFEKSPLFEGTSAELITYGNASSSASELSFNRLMALDIYADKTNILINLPLFNGGLKIPLDAKPQKMDSDSAPSDSDKFVLAAVIGFFSNNNIDFTKFMGSTGADLKELLMQANIETQNSDTVKIGDTEKKADVYLIDLSESDMQRLADIINGYLNKHKIKTESDIEEALIDFAKNNKLYLKIKNYNLYEIELINKNGENHTISFSGSGNQFDAITYFHNEKAELTRTQTTYNSKTTNVIIQNGKKLLVLTRSNEKTSFVLNNNGTKIIVKAIGMNISKDTVSYENLEIKYGDTFSTTGEYSLTKQTSPKAVEFEKSGKYLDITKLSSEEWEAILTSITNLLDNIPFI